MRQSGCEAAAATHVISFARHASAGGTPGLDQKVEQPAGTDNEASRPARSVWLRARSRVRDLGLPGKLLILTIVFVMLAEVMIFVPSIANYRVNWLTERLRSAQLASLAAEASPEGVVPQGLRDELLRTAQVRAVALKRDAQRQLILAICRPPAPTQRAPMPVSGWRRCGMPWRCCFRRATAHCAS